jgi:selenium metabolism protein YedF
MRSGNIGDTVVLIRSDTIGQGDDELGATLMMNFLHHLSSAEPAPQFVVLMNAGVKLAVEGSEVLDSLQRLEERGTTVLACGTCLQFFKLDDKQKAGKTSNMPEIIKTLLDSSKVITI